MIKAGISLIITTYNWPKALDVVLERLLDQTLFPDEVIIADDGSTSETKELIDLWRGKLPFPIIHSWIEDDGFRAAMSRNMAIEKSKYNYIIFIDGDILIRNHFIEDHRKYRQDGYFISGSRARLSKSLTSKILNKEIKRENFFTKGVGRRLTFIRWPFYHRMFPGILNHYRKVRSCHLSVWREDLIDVDGFDESFEGWGLEDSDLVVRLMNNGVKRKNIHLLASCSHIYHEQKENDRFAENEEYLKGAIGEKYICARKGISTH
ncbi:glycosyltransferase family 2 protein [Halosquirtibacter xylanolyticus]|uniref:glycosyltransferase family 2 protein n=1 Tax=Halosquirtibacter xylanolyticus TaxID=3374599 RepID=UPI0037486A31|nr:glycosyltransferase family 2 protein [Prolixibacteraceae bacterium]